MTATTRSIDRWEKSDHLETIAQRIEIWERLERELGVDLGDLLGLPDLASLKRGLEILRREVALRLEKADPLVDLPGPLLS